eukprot:gene7512-8309_t
MSELVATTQHENCRVRFSDFIILMANFASSGSRLPLDILFMIFQEYVAFWPTMVLRDNRSHRFGNNADTVFQNLSLSYMNGFVPTKIELDVVSKDQGWSSYPDEHGLRNSNTWGELTLSSSPEKRYRIYTNIHAGSTYENHYYCFAAGSPVIKELQRILSSPCNSSENVTIELRARALYPGWVNNIASSAITVFFGPSSSMLDYIGELQKRFHKF